MIKHKATCTKVRTLIIQKYTLERLGLRNTLKEYPFINIIGEAENEQEALKIINKIQLDVIIMDLFIEKQERINLIKNIKYKFKNIKIIILTEHTKPEDIILAINAGISAYCIKNIKPETLALVIKNVAMGANWIDPYISLGALNFISNSSKLNTNYNNADKKYCNIKLTERELEVLKHLVSGKSNSEIAKALIVSVHTAKAHVCNIFQKMCVEDRVQAAVKAVRENIIN